MAETHDLTEFLSFAITLAQEAGKMIKDATENRMSGTGNQFLVKYDNPTDLVTETDQAVEKYIKKRLAETYPDHRFIGEETMAEGVDAVFTDEPTWIVDPIDGTTNFVHGHPFVAVSIGLTIGKEPVVGVVYCPLMNELFSAAKGHGAFLNQSIRLPFFQPTPPPLGDLSQCVVATEAGSDRSPEVIDKKIETIHTILKQKQHNGKEAHSIRCTGSAAINLCTVAKGVVDVYWEVGCWEWDVVAAIVIVRESGGIVVTGSHQPDPAPVNIFSRKYLAIRAAQDENSQLNVAQQMWDIIPEITAPRKAVPGGFEP
ncbi:inositol monophosphatase 2 [Phascolomyces articulosus]|uniref:Inositol-1-monophosphatase n=1 Tax=Phascolomyces articulosus TaxID=60185 RepID=A0AAD5JTI5_9FUNG|nr:inositol monophosphatase 2 [Phascolomyces articulosus]